MIRNEKSGSLTVNNLKPEECLALNSMNKRRFLNRQIYVTSVVGDSPAKLPPVSLVDPVTQLTKSSSLNIGLVDPETGAISKIPPVIPSFGEPLLPRPVNSSDQLNGFVFGLVSPGVQDKIDHIEELKRKSEGSPEGDILTRKEKKILKKEEKSQKKKEFKDNRNFQETNNC